MDDLGSSVIPRDERVWKLANPGALEENKVEEKRLSNLSTVWGIICLSFSLTITLSKKFGWFWQWEDIKVQEAMTFLKNIP